MKNKGAIFDFMRGGQLFFSFLAMTMGVIKKNLNLFFYIWGGITVASCVFLTDEGQRNMGYRYALGVFNSQYFANGDTRTEFVLPSGKAVVTTWDKVAGSQYMYDNWILFKEDCIVYAILSGMLTVSIYFLWFLVIAKFGRSQRGNDFIRGGELTTIAEHNKRVGKEEREQKRKSYMSIADVKVPPKSDNTSMMLIGAPGTGKSATLNQLLTQIRSVKGRCIIYDRNGDFTRKFYREGVDKILNVRDVRCVEWSVWSEGGNQIQYRTVSSSMIPDTGSDPFWSQSARLVFEAVCEKVMAVCSQRGERPSMEYLMSVLLTWDNEKLANLVKGTDAASVFNMDSEKMAGSIRSTLSTYVESLKHLRSGGSPFSFREWVNSENDSWVFIPVKADEIELFKPLITVWIEQYVKAILNKDSESHLSDIRFNLIIDELASLNKLNTLSLYLSEGRKFGGNAILGTQNPAQLKDIYGENGAEKITGTVGSYVIYRNNSPGGLKWSSDMLTKEEIEEHSDNLTVGHQDIRDSLSMNKKRNERVLVTESEIVNLPDLEGFVRFGRGFGVVRFKQTYLKLPNISEPFIYASSNYQPSHRYPSNSESPCTFDDDVVDSRSALSPSFASESVQNQNDSPPTRALDIPQIDSYSDNQQHIYEEPVDGAFYEDNYHIPLGIVVPSSPSSDSTADEEELHESQSSSDSSGAGLVTPPKPKSQDLAEQNVSNRGKQKSLFTRDL